ncbi:MAG TPA: PqqD family protein [Candidatus Binatia bacterium]|nr:PqqD family protein [Candidatus Binatia bacterium]
MGWLAQNPAVICTELEEGAVLLNMETRTYYSLNDSAREIWRLVEVVASAEELAGALCRFFDVGVEEARSSIATFLERLRLERLVVERDEAPARQASQSEPVPSAKRKLSTPELIKHDEPLHEVPINPFDPQLPLAE